LYERLRRFWHERGTKGHGWIRAEDVAHPEPLDDIRLFGVVSAWCEGDIVYSTVKNAYAQGCEAVFLVDNASPDNTRQEASAAGAPVERSFATRFFDEILRIRMVVDVVERRSDALEVPHVWWLLLDADEFPHGPAGMTIREYLATLDRRYRIVGSRVFNHYPDRKPAMLPGFHPIEFQPLCEEHRIFKCALGHWKHQLLRYDRHGPGVRPAGGMHAARCKDVLIEPRTPIVMHHFPYRDEQITRRRLELLCLPGRDGVSRSSINDGFLHGSNALRRFRSLDAVYAQRWAEVDNLRRDPQSVGVRPDSWFEIADPAERGFARWYSEDELAAAWRAYHNGVPLGTPRRSCGSGLLSE